MKQVIQITLMSDVYSMVYRTPAGKGFLKYGSRGERVKAVSDRDTALIVENNKGDRFPISRTDARFEG